MRSPRSVTLACLIHGVVGVRRCHPSTVKLPPCESIQGPARALCKGLELLASAGCAQLQQRSFLAHAIQTVGLANHKRGKLLYGPVSVKHMHPEATSAGLTQQPYQLASALIELSQHQIESYLELGIAQAWTLCFITAYLSRYTSSIVEPLHSFGVDIKLTSIGQDTQPLLDALGIRVGVRATKQPSMVPRLTGGASRLGLCFIDAAHGYGSVYRDYLELLPHCRLFMFHDVFDYDVGKVSRLVPVYYMCAPGCSRSP